MSKFQEKYDSLLESLKKVEENPDTDLFMSVIKGLGPSIYNSDSAFVSTSDKSETDRLKKNFLIKKLGLSDGEELDQAIDAVSEKVGRSSARKHRAIFYYLLTKHFKKENIYAK